MSSVLKGWEYLLPLLIYRVVIIITSSYSIIANSGYGIRKSISLNIIELQVDAASTTYSDLPLKNDIPRPLFPYQKEIVDALDSEQHKLVAIAKARSVGASELCLRYILWLCVRDDAMRNKNMAIVTGIREELSLELLRRFKNLLPSMEWNTKEALADINGCRITAYPSKRVKDLRGTTDMKFILCDEADHYDSSDSEQLLPILEALLPKSGPKIVLVSTPGPIGSLMYKLYREPDHKCRYRRLYIPYSKAVGTMFTDEEIAKAKLQPNFSVEFGLQWGSAGTGNVYSH